jgi:hypothetical protein
MRKRSRVEIAENAEVKFKFSSTYSESAYKLFELPAEVAKCVEAGETYVCCCCVV